MATFALMMLLTLFMTASPVSSDTIQNLSTEGNANPLCLSYGDSTTTEPQDNMEVTTEICDSKDPRQNSWFMLTVRVQSRDVKVVRFCVQAKPKPLCYIQEKKIRNYLGTVSSESDLKRLDFELLSDSSISKPRTNDCIEAVAAGKGPRIASCDDFGRNMAQKWRIQK